MSPFNRPVSKTNRTVADDAARWFLRLQESTATPQTFRDWQQWLNAMPEHRRVYEEIEETALRVGRIPVMPELPSAGEMGRDTYDGSQPIAAWKGGVDSAAKAGERRGYRFAIAAGVAVVGIASLWLWAQYVRQAEFGSFVYQTTSGQKQLVELPDGSRVTLDADSALNVRLTRARRSLTLSRGEAYFQVAKDRSRPFTVQAGATQVTAVGTAFNVRMSENRTVVAVVEGKVEVAARPQTGDDRQVLAAERRKTDRSLTQGGESRSSTLQLTAQVGAGEAVSYVDDGNLHALPAAEVSLATGWLEGRRQYRKEPLRYVLADLNRYTGQRIQIGDEATATLQFTGTLDLQNSEGWLRGLSVALPVTVKRNEDGSLAVAHR